MKQDSQSITIKSTLQASPQEVFDAFTNASAFCEWLCDVAEADSRQGGHLYLWWRSGYYASGEYRRLVPDEKILFTWHGRKDPGITRVRVSVQPIDSGSEVTLTHSGLGTGSAWKKSAKEIKKGWKTSLRNLKSVLETGHDLRVINRPVLGASLEPLKAETAKTLGIPVRKGARVLNVVEGLSAQSAGLQIDDVIVRMGGEKISSLEDCRAVIDRHRAGDKIKLSYYRGTEKHALKLSLSARPVPEIPATLEELITVMQKGQAQAERAVSRALSGAQEGEVTFRLSPQEANACEVMAHLIILERDLQTWLSGSLEAQRTFESISHTHQVTRLQALATAFPNHTALLTELKRSHKETLGILQGLPAEIVSRKAAYWRMATLLTSLPEHTIAHARQIKSLVEAARKSPGLTEHASPHSTKASAA